MMALRSKALAWAASGFLLASLLAIWILGDAMRRATEVIGPTAADPFFNLYLLEWGARHWTAGWDGFWSAPFFFPTLLATTFSDHLLLQAAIYAGARALGATPALGYNALWIAAFSSTTVSLFFLVRKAARTSNAVALGAALLVTFAPWRLGQLTHIQMLWALGPPWLLLAVDVFLRRPNPRRAVGVLAAAAVTLLSGCYLAYFSLLLVAGLCVAHLSRQATRTRLKRHLVLAFALALLCLATGVAVFLPYVEARASLGIHRTNLDFELYGARPSDWLAPSWMNLYSGLVPAGWKNPERDLFPGFALLLGLAMTMAWRVSNRRSRASLPILGRVLACSALVLVPLEFARAFEMASRLLPGLDGMRVPTRAHFFVLLGAAVLAAHGAPRLLGGLGSRSLRVAFGAALVAAGIADLSLHRLPASAFFAPEAFDAMPPYVSFLRSAPVRALAVFPLGGNEDDIQQMWRSLAHGKPIANGHSGYISQSLRSLKHTCRFPKRRISEECVNEMRSMGLSHFVIETSGSAVEESAAARRNSVVREGTGGIALVYSDRDALVFALDTSSAEAPSGAAATDH